VYSGPDKAHNCTMSASATTTSTAVIPILVYEDIQAGHDFLVEVFGLTSGGLHRLDDGTVVHGEVRNGDAPIWLHRVTAEAAMDSPRDAAASHGGLSVRIPDVDAHYARVKAAGARTESQPTDQPYGLREYGVRDLENHRWWFSSPLA
jgi:MerR family transcriptional regulator, thiopeptide resistance regulator